MQVKVKQIVHVLALGSGQVTRVFPDSSFDVKIGGYGEMHFSAEGQIGQSGVQRVFYQDPMLIIPPNNPKLWASFRQMALSMYAELAKLEAAGMIAAETEISDA